MIKVGVVGCGDVAIKSYLPALAKEFTPWAELTAVCDSSGTRAKTAAEKYRAGAAFTDYRKFLLEADIDLVAILTPLLTHAKFALPAIRAGKHVFTEKPVAGTAKLARQMVLGARKHRVVLASAPFCPASPLILEAQRLVREGAIGKPCLARARSSHGGPEEWPWNTDPSWVFRKSISGPVPPLFDMGIYGLSALVAVLGPVVRVSSFSGLGLKERRIALVQQQDFKPYTLKVDSHDNSMSVLDFGAGRMATLDASYCMRVGYGHSHEFFGTEGYLSFDIWTGWSGASGWRRTLTSPGAETWPTAWATCWNAWPPKRSRKTPASSAPIWWRCWRRQSGPQRRGRR
jgi:predicted dehydrogenase